jgi:large exoprotein involved in heme utilization and adhesion
MNVSAIDPTSAALVTQQVAAANPPAKKVPSAAAATVAALATPAAKVAISGVPATVKPEDRALYMQILKSVGGNVTMALAALAAREASEAQS